MPLFVFLPYALVMFPLALRSTSNRLILRNTVIGLVGYGVSDCAAVALRDSYYWPIVVDVYSEQKAAESRFLMGLAPEETEQELEGDELLAYKNEEASMKTKV